MLDIVNVQGKCVYNTQPGVYDHKCHLLYGKRS